MVEQDTVDRRERPGLRLPALAAGGAFVLVIAAGAAYFLGTMRSTVSIHTGIASSGDVATSVEADGWTYSVPWDGVYWVDSINRLHMDGEPACLPPARSSGSPHLRRN